MINYISKENEERASEIIRKFSELEAKIEIPNLEDDISHRIEVYKWSQPFSASPERKNAIFSRDLNRLERMYDSFINGAASQISDIALESHMLAAALKSDAATFHEEEGTPLDWVPTIIKIGETKFFDEVIYRALSHMVLDDYGVPRWESMKSMGKIGDRRLLPILERAYAGRFRNPYTPSGNFEPCIEALLYMGNKTPEALEFLYEHYDEIDSGKVPIGKDLRYRVDEALTNAGFL